MKQSAILIILAAIWVQFVNAQNDSLTDKHGIQVIAKNYGDSVVLRWAPENFMDWSQLNQVGYQVMRFEISNQVTANSKATMMNKDAIKPWPLETWKNVFGMDNSYAPAVAQAIYGNSFTTSTNQSLGELYNLSNEQKMRFGIACMLSDYDAAVASASGLRFTDKNVQRDKIYLYLVCAANSSLKVDTGFVSVYMSEKMELPPIPSPKYLDFEKNVILGWDNTTLAEYYCGYDVERKNAQSGRWERINKLPIKEFYDEKSIGNSKMCIYSDTAANKTYTAYIYRIKGITPFGETTAAGEEIKVILRDKTPPPSPQIIEAKSKNNKMRITWEYDQKSLPDFEGFYVERSETKEGPFEVVNPSPLHISTRFFDDEPLQSAQVFYRVAARDTAGNSSYSLNALAISIDSIAPSKPIGLRGRIDSLGRVYLSWPLGKEKDIFGYRIYTSNSPDHEFSGITPKPVRDTFYVDTIALKTLSRKIYYRIVALDVNYNHSTFSEILVLKRPDIVKPVSPLFRDYNVSDTSVVIHFMESNSEDLASHTIKRREKSSGETVVVANWKSNEKRSSFSDKSVVAGKEYEYSISAVDSAGNASLDAGKLFVRIYRNIKSTEIENVVAQWDESKSAIQVSWSQPNQQVKYYIIYKAVDKGKLTSIGNVDGTETSFNDSIISKGNEFTYYVQAVFQSGNESNLSESNRLAK